MNLFGFIISGRERLFQMAYMLEYDGTFSVDIKFPRY